MTPAPDSREERPPQSHGLAVKAMRGLRWSYFSIVFNAVVQIGFAAALARLLDPTAFGIVALANVVLRYGLQLSQLGVGQAIVQRPKLGPDDVRAAFTSSLVLGVCFAAVFWAVAPLAGDLFRDQDVVWVIRALSAGFILTGIATTPMSLLRRDMDFRPIAVAEILAYVLGYGGVGISLAALSFGYWALVAASLAQQGLTALLLIVARRFDARPLLTWRRVKPLYSFGAMVTLISQLEITVGVLPTVWIGATMPARAVGLYNRASFLIGVPAQYVASGLSRVLLPSFARVQTEKERLCRAYVTTLTLFAAVVIPLGWGVAGAATEVVAVVLGDQWSAAVPALVFLSLAAPFGLLSHFAGILCEATATLGVKLVLTVGRLVVLVLLCWALSSRGIAGFALAWLIEEALTHGVYMAIVRRVTDARFGRLLAVYRVGLPAGIVAGGLTAGAHFAGAAIGLPAGLVLGIQIVAAGSVAFAFGWWGAGGLVRRELLRRWKQLREAG